MLRVTLPDSDHGMFCNMKAFDFVRSEESYPLYCLVVFGGLLTVILCLISPTVFHIQYPQKIVGHGASEHATS